MIKILPDQAKHWAKRLLGAPRTPALGWATRFSLAGDDFPALTHQCTELLVEASKHAPPAPVGPILFEGCPHVPRDFFIFHLPFVVSQSVLWGLARVIQPRRYLEIGTLSGSSLLAVTKGGRGCVEDVVSIDINRATQATAEQNLRASGYTGTALFLTADSRAVDVDGHFDLIYVDGDHTFDGARADIETFWGRVKPDGYLAVDNTVTTSCPKPRIRPTRMPGRRR